MAEGEELEFFDSTFLRKLETLAIFSRKAFAGRLRGEQRSNKHGSSVEFADFRQYSQGDDFRHIDWNAYARFDNLFLKLFTEEEDLFVYILLDTSASMGFGEPTTKFDLGRRLTAALAYIALSHLDRVTIEAVARRGGGRGPSVSAGGGGEEAAGKSGEMEDHLPFVRGKGSVFAVFEFLRQLRPEGETDLRRSVSEFLMRNKHKGVAVVISDFLSPGYEEALKQLQFAGFQPMALQILTKEEIDPPLSGDFRLIDSETGRPVDVSTTRKMLSSYKARVQAFIEGLQQFCKSRNISFIQTTADVLFEELMLSYLRRASMVK